MGIYRRRIRVVATDASTVRGDLEDDFHCFGVTLEHDMAPRHSLVEQLQTAANVSRNGLQHARAGNMSKC